MAGTYEITMAPVAEWFLWKEHGVCRRFTCHLNFKFQFNLAPILLGQVFDWVRQLSANTLEPFLVFFAGTAVY
jgi:hypothetical protein